MRNCRSVTTCWTSCRLVLSEALKRLYFGHGCTLDVDEEEILRRLLSKAGGNPSYVEETVLESCSGARGGAQLISPNPFTNLLLQTLPVTCAVFNG
jgi:hypothetical protein